MIELMKIGHIFESPKGLVISGTSPTFNNLTEISLKQTLKQLGKIWVREKPDIFHSLEILDIKITSSVGDNYNIHFLTKGIIPARLLREGTTVFCQELNLSLEKTQAKKDELKCI